MSKPKLNLSQLGIEQTLTLANGIKTAMTGNASFTTPVPSLASLGTLITTAQTALSDFAAAQDLAATKMAARDAALSCLQAGLSQLAGYVEAASAGDAVKIQSAGMGVRSPKTPLGLPGQVLNLVLTAGDFDGVLDSAWDAMSGVSIYELQTSPDPMSASSWSPKGMSTRSYATLEGLTSGSKVWLRVRAIASAGAGPWSDPAVKGVP